jgi:hypothetical protein
MLLSRTPPTRHPHQPRAPRPISNHDSPGWGPPPQGVRQDRATLPQYHAPRRYTSPSRQEPVRAPRGKDHGKPLAAPVGGEGSRGNTLLPSARGPIGFDSPGQLTTPSDPDPRHQHQHLPTGMPHGRKFDQPPRQHGGVASELVTEEEDLRLRHRSGYPPWTLPWLLEADDHFSQAMATLGPGQHDSDGPGVRQQQAAGTSSDSDSLGKSNHSTKETLSLPTCKDAGPYWARTRD